MRRLFLASALFFIQPLAPVAADSAPAPAPIETPRYRDGLVNRNEFRQLMATGNWDELIRRTTEILDEAQPPGNIAQTMLFRRATAAFTLGRLDLAAADLEQLKASPRAGQAVPELLDRIGRMRGALGNEVREVKSGDKVLFRVYFDIWDARTAAIVDQLVPAYEANRKMLPAEVTDTPVFIFTAPEKYRTFRQAQYPNAPLLSSQWASGGIAGMCFAPVRLSQSRAPEPGTNLFKTTIAHEFNHVLVARRLGSRDIPMWLFEGLAQHLESELDSSLVSGWNRRLTRIANAGQVVVPAQLETQADWTKAAEEGYRAATELKTGPDPYAQSWQLTSLFLKQLPVGALPKFLDEVRESGDFEATLSRVFKVTKADFYDQYIQAAKRMGRN